MKTLKPLSAIAIAMAISGCTTTGLYTRTGGGWISNFKEGVTVSSTTNSTKKGEACAESILGVAMGDASIDTAKKNGGINAVSSVDSEIKNILFLYGKNCTIVHGN